MRVPRRRNGESSALNVDLGTARSELLAAKVQLDANFAEREQDSRGQQFTLDAARARVAQAREQVSLAERISVRGGLVEDGGPVARHPISFVIGNLRSLTD